MKRITPRKLGLKFPVNIPKHWLGGSPFKTHLLNSFTLIFPTGEKFFIRSINKYLKDIKDAELKKAARAFIRQETQHYIEHEKFFKNLRKQGYDIDKFVKMVDHVVENLLEPVLGGKLNLATTAGLEHFTALLAEIGLKENFLAEAHPVMKELFEWHAAEEIEHRSVAYDILQAVDDSYLLRVLGLANAYVILSTFSAAATIYLLAKDGKVFKTNTLMEVVEVLLTREALFLKSINICFRYLHPDFHPDKSEVDELTTEIFNNLAMQGAA